MNKHIFPKVLRGYDTDVVDARLRELSDEVQSLRTQLSEATETNTTLRLNVIKQVEQAGAEAAVVLNHARNEATRIRELAVVDSEAVSQDASRARAELVSEATEARDEALSELEAQRAREVNIMARAKAQAKEIVDQATLTGQKIEAEAQETLEKSQRLSQDAHSELRLQKLEIDRMESDIRDQADSYAMRIYREADDYARKTEARALDLEKQAEEILAEAKKSAQEITARAIANGKRNLEDALGVVNSIFAEVNGSLVDVSRIRQVLGDSVDRLSLAQTAPAPSITDYKPVTVVTDVSGPTPENPEIS